VNTSVLPLAITMMAGPQIMSAIIFVTHEQALRVSLAFLTGVAVAVTLGTAIAVGLVSALGLSLGASEDTSSAGTVIQLVLVALLVLAAVKNYVRRETVEPPKWLGTLMEADAKKALTTGLLLILLMPSDVLVMLTVGTNLQQSDSSFADALPFIGLTILVAALPLLGYLLFHRRAVRVMPNVRDWMNSHSWLINILVCGIFTLLILA
jgi:hypothetical protein